MNITVVAGARPNFMKIAPLSHAVDRYNRESDRKNVSGDTLNRLAAGIMT